MNNEKLKPLGAGSCFGRDYGMPICWRCSFKDLCRIEFNKSEEKEVNKIGW
jgi:hypothetical protein